MAGDESARGERLPGTMQRKTAAALWQRPFGIASLALDQTTPTIGANGSAKGFPVTMPSWLKSWRAERGPTRSVMLERLTVVGVGKVLALVMRRTPCCWPLPTFRTK